MPGFRTDDRPAAWREVGFWIAVTLAAVGMTVWIHARDTGHGDHWDWSDWLEGVFAAVSAGLIGVGIVWVAAQAALDRLTGRRTRTARSDAEQRPR